MKRIVLSIAILLVCSSMLIAGGKTEEPAPTEVAIMDPNTDLYRQITYTDIETATAFVSDGPVLLFFHASWCPTCKAAMREFEARAAEIATDITLVIVDYDSNSDLKSRYGVTYQHTFVQIDESGEKLTIWNGGSVDAVNKRTVRS